MAAVSSRVVVCFFSLYGPETAGMNTTICMGAVS